MKLAGKIVSIGRHDRDGESIDGLLVEVPREQLEKVWMLYREVTITDNHHAKIKNPEVFNVDLLERERDAFAQKATALAVQVAELTRELETHAQDLSPAMVQARNDQLNAENAKLLARVKRLEEAGDAMAAVWSKEGITAGDVEAAIDDWFEAKEAKPVPCPKCGSEMRNGMALENKMHESSDPLGGTIYPTTEARMVTCSKCVSCGHSVKTKEAKP